MTPRSELTAIPTNEPLEQVFVLGTELFGLDSFRRWLIQPAYGLNYDVPVDLFRTSEGQQRVLEELTRIVYGDLA